MPAKSKSQQKFMGMVHALQKGEIKPSDVSDKVKKAADSMSDKDAEDFASTKHKGLPKKVKESFLKGMMLSENPAAGAAAAMAMMQLKNPDSGKKISAITPLRNKDHKLHNKAKGIFKKLKDKISKKKDKPTDKVSQYRALMQKQKDYKREEVEEGFGGELKGSDRKKFEKARKENAEVLGYKLTGTKDIKESVNEDINDKMKKIMTKLAKSLRIKSVVDMHTGKGSLSYFLDDEKEALKLQKFLQKSFKRVRKINLDKAEGDTANFVVAADMLGLESVNEGKKRYYQQDRVGSAKYTISYYDGKKKHKDGSDFFDIKTFRNKKDLAKFVNTLSKSGYVYGFNESVNEASGVDVAKKVLKNKQREKGIDLQTANLIVTIDKAYDKNPKLQKKFRAIQLPKMKQLIMKYYG